MTGLRIRVFSRMIRIQFFTDPGQLHPDPPPCLDPSIILICISNKNYKWIWIGQIKFMSKITPFPLPGLVRVNLESSAFYAPNKPMHNIVKSQIMKLLSPNNITLRQRVHFRDTDPGVLVRSCFKYGRIRSEHQV